MRFSPSDITRRLRSSIPVSCVFCDRSESNKRICQLCRRLLPWNDWFCDRCGQVMSAGLADGIDCAICQSKPPPFEKARSPLVYDFPVDAAIKAIKFRRQLWFVPAFAELLLGELNRSFPQADALVPVPLHRWRQIRRGFNQAEELCRPLRKATGLPILKNIIRVRATSAQTGLNAAERKKNLNNAFAVRENLNAAYPLIIDDVMTTGETCSQLAIELNNAGANSVFVLTVARSYAGTTGANV